MWEIIRYAQGVRSSTVFGLVGPWGTGKTSMIDWIKSAAETNPDKPKWSTVTFNPWDYQDAASLQAGFFAELTEVFGGPSRPDEVRRRISAFGRSVAPFASLGAIVGFDLSSSVDAAAKLLDVDRSVAVTRSRLESSLEAAKTPVLVIIDDLDRVSAEELLLTLKLVRQLGRLPYVHYLLSYDETTILDVLTRTSLIGEGSLGRARDYMEKVVQVRFDVPALRPSDAVRLTNQGLSDLAEDGRMQLSQEDSNRFSSAYFGFIAARLDTPRAIKRYFSQLRLLAPAMGSELDLVDFLVLTWLRTAEPAVYQLLQRKRADLIGSPRSSTSYGRSNRDHLENQGAEWRRQISDSGTRPEDIEGVGLAIGFLFPKFREAWSTKPTDAYRPRTLGIAQDVYFDRYFSVGVPEDDIADDTIRDALNAYSTGNEERSSAVMLVRIALERNPELVVGKISRELDARRPTEPGVFQWVATIHKDLPLDNTFLPPAQQLEAAVALLLRSMNEEQISAAVDSLVASGNSEFLVGVLYRATHEYSAEPTPSIALTERQLERARSLMVHELADSDPQRMSTSARSAAWSWSSVDPVGFRDWIESLRTRRGEIEALCFFVNSGVSLGTRTPISRLSVGNARI
ncbi:P-loop NTPase fold protein [Herbiconiux sp.]|uniref:KAP family P-loop NTPase fold protein n=1 Tax=Herbiconiux sp. TaxID=1871186 RepID=UPI0025B98FB4|nr:P-loop NTPase fold protein [Herbiconiux sp.]